MHPKTNNRDRSGIRLELQTSQFVVSGGNDNRVWLTFEEFECEGTVPKTIRMLALLDPTVTSDEEILINTGQYEYTPLRHTVSVEKAVEVVLHYLQTNSLPDGLTWVEMWV
jgi:hypothetical protein